MDEWRIHYEVGADGRWLDEDPHRHSHAAEDWGGWPESWGPEPSWTNCTEMNRALFLEAAGILSGLPGSLKLPGEPECGARNCFREAEALLCEAS